MRVTFSTRFWRDYYQLPPNIQEQTRKTLKLLRENPHHPSLRTHKRAGEPDVWQARVTRSYRIFFKIESGRLRMVRVVPHPK